MVGKRRLALLGVVGALSALAGCAEMESAQGTNEALEKLRETRAMERLIERTAPDIASAAGAPSYVVDPGWPKPLPNNWRIGQVGGLYVDHNDYVWVYHRPRSLDASEAAALEADGFDGQGRPVSGLGDPRLYGGQRAGCCVPAPSVLKFDMEGNLLDAWGGPADHGFLVDRCREEDGCFWPAREHGIFVDHNNYVYVSGNGQAGQVGLGQFPWAATFGDDSHVLKFTEDGDFIYQIGYAGMSGPNSDDVDGGPNNTPQPYLPADMTVDPTSNLLYIADGYGNRRILIVEAETGQYVGHFGAYGQNPVYDGSTGQADTYDAGPWMGDFARGEMRPRMFRSPLHCVKFTSDGLLYACDRGNNRIQIFNTDEVGEPCENPDAEAGVCGFVQEVYIAPHTQSGTATDLEFSPDETCMFVADLGNNTIYAINRHNYEELARIGRGGRQIGEFHWVHNIGLDSQGNLYSGEVDSGKRIQKFMRYGDRDGCSGSGAEIVGMYR